MRSLIIAPLLLCSFFLLGQTSKLSKEKQAVLDELDRYTDRYSDIAMQIWKNPELGYMEIKSSGLLSDQLKSEGFSVEKGIEKMPTAFIASYGSGKPVIGILAEFDALPGVSQAAVPMRQEREGVSSGHACGHHLFGTGSVAAAIAVKNWLQKSGVPGTIRLYGTPAEEGGNGKVYMARGGQFDDVDAAIYWHAGTENAVRANSNLAIVSVKYRFHGVSTHAAGAPHLGRSALDGVEAMNDMVNLMREHVPSETRIHYVITNGGEAPNVVPSFAEVYYFIRHPDMREVKAVLNRITKAAEGAALGTETTMDYEITGGSFNILPNLTLAEIMQANLEKIGGIEYTPEEREFAVSLMKTYKSEGLNPDDVSKVLPLDTSPDARNSSTDSGDVSWVCPLATMNAATWPPGTPGHSWQAVAAGGNSMSIKAMIVAAKTLALSALDYFRNPAGLEMAKKELIDRRGANFIYEPLIGNRAPELDYMKK